jgi:hypothetical protein
VSQETKKVISYESGISALSNSLAGEGWTLQNQERIDISEGEAMLKRDTRITNALGKEKQEAVFLLLYQRDKPKVNIEARQLPEKKAAPKPEISIAEKKREQKEPIFWLIACSVLFLGSFAFFIYSVQRSDRDYTCWMALANSIFMLAGIIYSIILIVKTRRDW